VREEDRMEPLRSTAANVAAWATQRDWSLSSAALRTVSAILRSSRSTEMEGGIDDREAAAEATTDILDDGDGEDGGDDGDAEAGPDDGARMAISAVILQSSISQC